MFKRAVEFSKGFLTEKRQSKKKEEEKADLDKEFEKALTRKYLLSIEINPLRRAEDLSALYPDISSLTLYLLDSANTKPYRGLVFRTFWIRIDPELNKRHRENRSRAAYSVSPPHLDEFLLLTADTYSTTVTQLIMRAMDCADIIQIRMEHHSDPMAGLACTGVSDALRITNSYSKLKSMEINSSAFIRNELCHFTEQHLDLFDSIKTKTELIVRYGTNCVPAHLIVKWITEWQNHEREIGSLVFNTLEFTELEEILAKVDFSYKDDGNVYKGIVKRKAKTVDEPISSAYHVEEEELWFRYWRQFLKQKPRIVISVEKSARPESRTVQ